MGRKAHSLEVLVELYPAIIGALSDIAYGKDSVSWNRETVSDANGLLSAIRKVFISANIGSCIQLYQRFNSVASATIY